MRTLVALAAVVALTAFRVMDDQSGDRLMNRWVGIHDGRQWWIDFYGDTMLVVDDTLVLGFRATRDSLIAYGDTSFAVSYWFVRDRLLVQTVEGEIVTMAPQDLMARPLSGEWRGTGIQLRMDRGGGARWRQVTGGPWTWGEWDRRTRTITFTWLPDSTIWTAQYDPPAAALLFQEIPPDGGPVILHRALRW